MKKYRFIQNISFNEFEHEYELETGSVLTKEVSQASVDLPYSPRSARGQSNSDHDVFSKRNTENAARLVGNITSLEAHGHILCSGLVFHD